MDLLADTTSFYCLVNFHVDHSVFLISLMAFKITFSRKDVFGSNREYVYKVLFKKGKAGADLLRSVFMTIHIKM